MFKKMLWLIALCFSAIITVSAQDVPVRTESVHEVTFRFVAGRDMLFSPWGGNGESLRRLSGFIREHREAILLGKTPVYVYGYCASAGTPEVRLRRARLMSNRVKSEMIVHDGLREEHFRTENFGEACGELRNAVVVRFVLPQKEKDADATADGQTKGEGVEKGEEILRSALNDSVCSASCCSDSISSGHSESTSLCHSEQSEESLLPASSRSLSSARGWSFGLNLGIPFFWGDMASMSADKTYLGFGIGVQAETRFSSLLGASLSVDYARGKAGAREYSKNYQLAPSGMTLYGHGTDASLAYGELYSRISVVSAGLGLDVYLNRLFGSRAADSRFQAILTPTVYGQFFSATLYDKLSDEKFSDGSTKPAALSLGLGGALALRYRIAPAWSVQLKNSVVWLTDNKFDGIVTPYDHTRQNALWLPQLGVVWNIK